MLGWLSRACLLCICVTDQAAVMCCFAAAITLMLFRAPPSVNTGIKSEITHWDHNMSKTTAADNVITPPNNTQDVVIHFLEHIFISGPHCALCAFDVMFFLTRTTARHVCGSHYSQWMGGSFKGQMIATALFSFISLALHHSLSEMSFGLSDIQRYWNQFHYPPLLQTDWLISCIVTAKGNYFFHLALWEL